MAYNAFMDRARHFGFICIAAGIMLGVMLLAPGCHKQQRLPTTGGVSGQPARDEILTGLQGQLPDECQFALLFITRFKLPGYEQPVRQLARDNPIAGVALACVYRNPQPLLDWRARQPDQAAALNGVLGAVYGLGCAADVPEALWDGVLEHTPPAQRVDLLWGLAQLVRGTGGGAGAERQARARWRRSCAALAATLGLEQRGAYDAVLGGVAGHESPGRNMRLRRAAWS